MEKDALYDSYYYHSDTITAIAVGTEENFLVTGFKFSLDLNNFFKGSKSGECIVWAISPEATKLSVKYQLFDHKDKVSRFIRIIMKL